jgi:hypothetical protein
MSAGIQIAALIIVSAGFVVFLVALVVSGERRAVKAQMEQQNFLESKAVTAEQYRAVFSAIERGENARFDEDKLIECARVLSAYQLAHEAKADPTTAALFIHNLQVAHLLRRIDRSNRIIQASMIALGLITSIVVCLQIWLILSR